jgi:hypothetical protein
MTNITTLLPQIGITNAILLGLAFAVAILILELLLRLAWRRLSRWIVDQQYRSMVRQTPAALREQYIAVYDRIDERLTPLANDISARLAGASMGREERARLGRDLACTGYLLAHGAILSTCARRALPPPATGHAGVSTHSAEHEAQEHVDFHVRRMIAEFEPDEEPLSPSVLDLALADVLPSIQARLSQRNPSPRGSEQLGSRLQTIGHILMANQHQYQPQTSPQA